MREAHFLAKGEVKKVRVEFCPEMFARRTINVPGVLMAAVFIPIAYSIAQAGGHDPMLAMMNIIFSCGFAFMLPQGTPPNALAVGSGLIENQQMLKSGTVVKIAILILYPIMLFALRAIGFIRV